MKNKKEIIDESHFLSDRISTQVRMVALSLIIIIWGFLIDRSGTALITTQASKKSLIIVGLIALLTMVFDFFQYLAGYINNRDLLKKMEKANLREIEYDYKAASYRLRGFFFMAKQASLFTALIWFGFIIIPLILP